MNWIQTVKEDAKALWGKIWGTKPLPKNWRFVAVALVACFAISFAVSYVSSAVDIKMMVAEAKASGNALDAEDIPSVTGEAWARTAGALYGFVELANLLLILSAVFICTAVIRWFWGPNTLYKHRGELFNEGWTLMSLQERTRWVLGLFLVVLFVLFSGRANAAAQHPGYVPPVEYNVPMVENENLALPISEEARDLITYYEVGGKAYYDKRLTKPTVPAWRTTASGVTVGFGTDVGHMTKAQIAEATAGVLTPTETRALQSVSGLRGSAAYYSGLPKVKHLRITWDQAEQIFDNYTLPRFTALTKSAFNLEADRLHPHCNGALTSIVFNRGSSMRGSSRAEMRYIRDDIAAGMAGRVPGHILGMKRLWSYTKLKGLHLRRNAEAKLFSTGLRLRQTAHCRLDAVALAA